MQWSATVGIVIFIVFAGSVKGILAFSFCAVVAFVFARNLFDGANKLDFTPYFASKGLAIAKERETLSITTRPFPRRLKTCRHALIRNILRDFVISWYENVAIGGDFILETRSLLEEATVSFYDKLSRTSVSSHTEKLCILLHRHLATAQAAKILMPENHKNFVETYRSLQEKTRTYQNDELQYLRNVIDLLLYRLVPPKTLGCNTGRFILREILAFKLMLPLVDTISDPDFVNTSIINIFGENTDENLLTTSLEINETSKSNLKVSTSFMEYLDQNLELNGSNNSGKLAQSESVTKYKFKDATVIEKDHSEIVELSMEAHSQEDNGLSNLAGRDESTVYCPSTNAETADKTSEPAVRKRPKLTAKEPSHSSIINGLTKVKNDIFKANKEKGQNSKFNAVLSAKVHPSGIMFARQLQKTHSSPVIKKIAGANLGESLPKREISSERVSDTDGCSDLLKESGENCSSQGRLVSLGCDDTGSVTINDDTVQSDSQSTPKLISGHVERESTSSFEVVDMYDSATKTDAVDFPDSGNSTNDLKTVDQKKFEILSNDEQSKASQTNVNSAKSRQHTTSFSSTDEWDSEVFEKSEEGLQFHVRDDFSEADGVALNSGLTEDYIVSRADFAIHDVPNPCSMISIPSTELVTDHSFEPYKSRYTVYVIEYNTQLWLHSESDDHPEEIERSETDTQGSKRRYRDKRRYREFMELHHRLVCGSFASLMKDIPKPNRKFNSPFFRLDQDVIEGRQILLENYLKCLVNKPAILHCEDFKGFLGIGDESHTDFRRHIIVVPTLPNVPRIDKKLQKKVTKIIDHIKTAFDTGPVDGDKEEEYEDIRQVLGEDKTSQDEIRTFAICSEGCKLNHSCCYSDNCFHTFVQQQHDANQAIAEHPTPETIQQTKEVPATRLNSKNTCAENGHAKNGKSMPNSNQLNSSKIPRKQSTASTVFDNGGSVSCDGQEQGTTNPLTKTVLNLSCRLLEKRESWVCLEPVQEAATAVFGCFLEWWMEGLLSELVTEEQWQYYLTLFTDTVWPGGELMKSSEQEKTEEEKLKTKEEAIQTLSNFFGAVLHTAIGTETIECSAREIVESLQNAEINRQVLLEVLEVILAEVFPELMDEKDSYLSSRNC